MGCRETTQEAATDWDQYQSYGEMECDEDAVKGAGCLYLTLTVNQKTPVFFFFLPNLSKEG